MQRKFQGSKASRVFSRMLKESHHIRIKDWLSHCLTSGEGDGDYGKWIAFYNIN